MHILANTEAGFRSNSRMEVPGNNYSWGVEMLGVKESTFDGTSQKSGNELVGSIPKWSASNQTSVVFSLSRMLNSNEGAGAALICRFGADAIEIIEEALRASGTAPTVINVACSSFSQKMRFGALLYLLAEEEGTVGSSSSTYFALRRIFAVAPGAEPMVVILENAQNLDSDSASLLCQLAAIGHIRLIATSPRGDILGEELTALIANKLLKRLDVIPLAESSMAKWLESSLAGPVSEFVIGHYWKLTGGNCGALQRLVEQDLTDRNLVRENSVWVMARPSKRSSVLDIYAHETMLGLSIDARALMDRMIRSRYPSLNIATPDQAEVRGLDELCAAGLIETTGPGCYVMTGVNIDRVAPWQSAQYNEPQLRELDSQLSILAADVVDGLHSEVIARLEALFDDRIFRLIELEGNETLASLAIAISWIASNQGDDEAACDSFIERLACNIHATDVDCEEFDQHLSIVRLGLGLRAGDLGRLAFLVPDGYDAGDVIDRIVWKSESTRLFASLVVAEAWMLNGSQTQAHELMAWAQLEQARLEATSPDSRLRLLAIQLRRTLVFLPMVGGSWMENSGSLAQGEPLEETTGPSTMLTAFGRGAFSSFAGESSDALRWLVPTLEQWRYTGSDSDRHLAEAFVEYCNSGLGNRTPRCSLRAMPASGQLSISTWAASFVLLLSGLESGTEPADQRELRKLADICRLAGYRGLELHTLGAAVAYGDESALEQLIACQSKVDGPLSRRLGELARAIIEKNLESEISARSMLVRHGMRFYADSFLENESSVSTMAKRKLQRARGHLHLNQRALYSELHGGPRLHEVQSETMLEEEWLDQLTKREKVIARLAAGGIRNGDIARRCGISIRTVEGHLYQIHAKLNLSSRQELVLLGRGERR